MGGRGHESRRWSDTKVSTTGWQSSPSDLNQDGLHGEIAFPLAQAGEFGEVDLIVLFNMQSECVYLVDRTLPFLWSTQGRLTLEMKVTSGGTSG